MRYVPGYARGVNLANHKFPPQFSAATNVDDSGTVTINELIAAVDEALNG